jgi:indole-3-glycerol phosphate synthase/phosphoribosylanthranilate isomerase
MMLPLNETSISENVLGKIIARKKVWLEKRMAQEPLETFRDQLVPSDRSLAAALTENKTNFILECKKASPSKGLIRPDFNVQEIASVYDRYAQAVSVLAEEDFFQGNVSYIAEARKCFHGPVICKDFIIDPYQVYLARKYQADAILLMLSVLPDESYIELARTAQSLNLDVLTEASNPEEIGRAIRLGAKIIGINNRNLRDLTVDLSRTEVYAKLIPDDRIKVCESGIYTHQDVLRLAPLVNGFLVGSSLTSQLNIDHACRKLVFGDIKVCGLTRNEEASAVAENGGLFGGLIFAEKSPRHVTDEQAEKVIQNADLNYIGVFVNASTAEMVGKAKALKLYGLQLHGQESVEQIKELRSVLPHIKIWKAVAVGDDTEKTLETIKKYLPHADKFVLDTRINNQCGGTGVAFDWKILEQITSEMAKWIYESNQSSAVYNPTRISSLAPFAEKARSMLILAGGLNCENAEEAVKQKTFGLDFNSGLESAPGCKDLHKIKELFKILRNY